MLQPSSPRPAASPKLPAPRLLVELEPWHRSFLNNLRDAVTRRELPALSLTTRTAPFWDDVFVKPHFPRFWLLQSVLYHCALVGLMFAYDALLAWHPHGTVTVSQQTAPLTSYQLSDYLPPVTSGSAPAKVERKGQPAYAKQEIVSAPLHPDNFSQTIVNPAEPQILANEVPLPNIVIWTPTPSAVPVAGLQRKGNKLVMPDTTPEVVPPAPDVARAKVTGVPELPEPSVDAPPPPTPETTRQLGEINIAESDVQIDKPALPVPVQRAAPKLTENGTGGGGKPGANGSPAAPQIPGNGTTANAVGQFIALNLHPTAPSGPIDVPKGNRRGLFAAGPTGTPGAPGTPEIHGGGTGNGGTGTANTGGLGGGNSLGESPGIYVAPGPTNPGTAVVQATPAPTPSNTPKNTPTLNQLLAMTATTPRPSDMTPPSNATTNSNLPNVPISDGIEDRVFGGKRYYQMILNMPNLTSAGGSWIMRFAELHQTSDKSDLTAPVAVHKVDPAYPADLIKSHVEGVVTLYAVIHADGTVGEVHVISGVDERLDLYAQNALLRWQFRPATKNGAAVDLETVVRIPFVAKRVF